MTHMIVFLQVSRESAIFGLICRSAETLRDEIKPLFFSETAFMVDETTWDFDGWLETIGPEAIGQLRKVTIRCEGRCRE